MRFVSLFSGAGGLDLGFEWAGFEPLIAFDVDPAAVQTYNYNRSAEIAVQGDLSELTGDDIICRINRLPLDDVPCGVVGGPPCQYYSNGNRATRRDNDPRRTLPASYAKTLRRLNEEYNLDFFILENVYGLVHPSHHEDFNHIIQLFEQAGFRVFTSVLNAYNFGVPQVRRRVFLVGWSSTRYPDAEYTFPAGVPCGRTVRDAIYGLNEPVFWSRNLDPDDFPEHPNHWTMQPVSEKFRNPAPAGLGRYTRSFRRLSWDAPSDTVAYGHNEIHVHPEGHRRLSIYEAMLIQGFPRGRQTYRLLGSFSKQVTLISDVVPPPLAEALAQSVVQFITDHSDHVRLDRETRPENTEATVRLVSHRR